MPSRSFADALVSLLSLARGLTHATMTAAVIQRPQGEVHLLTAEPPIGLAQAPVWFGSLPVGTHETAHALQLLSPDQWPSLSAIGLPFTPARVAELDCSAWGKQVVGGFLFLWDAVQAHHAAALLTDPDKSAAPVFLLRPVCANLLDTRERSGQMVESGTLLHDIFNSLSQGVVVVSAQETHAQVNHTASSLLEVKTGLVAVDVLAQAMRKARRRCDNAAELELAYNSLQHSLDAEMVVNWHLDDQIWRVDTHPILHDGHNGRIWLFHDVTAQIRLEQVLRQEALRDGLTGLFNRRAFFDRAQAHYQMQATSVARTPKPTGQLALLMLDIDHFKLVNDRFGHPVGDIVIRDVATRAQALLRDGDLLARYGGEEFILLLGPTTLIDARATAERIRLAIAEQPVQANGYTIEVRVSVGVTLRHDVRETLAQTLDRADANLYRAKREGRNRVIADGDSLAVET